MHEVKKRKQIFWILLLVTPSPQILLYPWIWFSTWYFIFFFVQFLQGALIRGSEVVMVRDWGMMSSTLLMFSSFLRKPKNPLQLYMESHHCHYGETAVFALHLGGSVHQCPASTLKLGWMPDCWLSVPLAWRSYLL